MPQTIIKQGQILERFNHRFGSVEIQSAQKQVVDKDHDKLAVHIVVHTTKRLKGKPVRERNHGFQQRWIFYVQDKHGVYEVDIDVESRKLIMGGQTNHYRVMSIDFVNGG